MLVLVGLSFAALFFAYSATIRSEAAFALIFRLLVIPLFLFSGAFFPISNLAAGRWSGSPGSRRCGTAST